MKIEDLKLVEPVDITMQKPVLTSFQAFTQFICGLRGHQNSLLSFKDRSLVVRCHDCGYESPGFKHEHESQRQEGQS